VIELNRNIDDRLNEFNRNVVDICNSYPELEPFISDAMKKINEKYLYEYATFDTLHKIHDEIHKMWKYYRFKYNEKLIKDTYTKYETIGGSDMGINMKENESEGKAFSNAMAFDTKDKVTDEQIKPLPKSNGEWNKYLENQIMPNINKQCEEKTSVKTNTDRPNKIEYYLGIAKAVSTRGTCLRRRFGAIVVKDDRVVSSGYVGAPRGRMNCCDRGTCFRMENNIPSGQRYELCRSVHAEMNAIINASKEELEGGVMYLVGVEPDGSYTPNADCCSMCKRVIINAGIRYVVIATDNGPKTIPVQEWIDNDDSLTLHEGY
jgi:dCMP deaminase